jgi:ribonuclease VapC
MIVDASALIAILQQESDAFRYSAALATSPLKRMGAPTFLEVCMVIAGRRGPDAVGDVNELIRATGIELLAFTPEAGRVAVDAFLKFGKGRHKAALNFGDCISYALAKTEAMPLLFKGDDFRLTDIGAAL